MTENKRRGLVGGLINDDNNKKAVANSVVIPKRETRSARVYATVKPSVKQKALDKIESLDGKITLNEVINQLLENWIDE